MVGKWRSSGLTMLSKRTHYIFHTIVTSMVHFNSNVCKVVKDNDSTSLLFPTIKVIYLGQKQLQQIVVVNEHRLI